MKQESVQDGAKTKTMDAKLGPSCTNFWGSMHFQQALLHPFGLTAAGPWHFHPAIHKSYSLLQIRNNNSRGKMHRYSQSFRLKGRKIVDMDVCQRVDSARRKDRYWHRL